MSARNSIHQNHRRARKSRNSRVLVVVVPVVAVALLVAGAWLSTGDGTNESGEKSSSAGGVSIPIENSPQTVLGLMIRESVADRGRLPLNTPVTQVYEFVNTGTSVVELGEPTIEVLEGCCPPPLQMTQMTVEPGQKASVGFSTQMHKGMDGPHLFHLTLPVRSADGEDSLHFYFKGDFRG